MQSKERAKIVRAVFAVRGIDCATCASIIKKKVEKMDGVKSVETAVMLNKVFIEYDKSKVDVSEIMKVIEKAGFGNYLTRTR